MARISPFLWYDSQAEEAAKLYVSIFPNSKMGAISRYGKEAAAMSNRKPGSVMTVSFELDGQSFTAINGGPLFQFTEAISFVIPCKDQKEIDYYWSKLTANGGAESQCGWLKDKFGLSWQVIPANLPELLGGPDAAKNGRAMQAMLSMKKIDIAKMKNA